MLSWYRLPSLATSWVLEVVLVDTCGAVLMAEFVASDVPVFQVVVVVVAAAGFQLLHFVASAAAPQVVIVHRKCFWSLYSLIIC
jgi:hypothetical protein